MRRARTLAPELRAIVLSARQDTEHIDAALAGGAAAYVVKTAQAEDVSYAVRQAFDHSVFLAGSPRPCGPARPRCARYFLHSMPR
jgi:DNA-binding NarL/FixJ family response regulator